MSGLPPTLGSTDDQRAAHALEFRALRKNYGAIEAVRGVDLVVRQGEFVTLLGPSGSGKTTILKVVAGFEQPTSGEVLLDGRDVTAFPPAARGIGMVFQQYALFPHMTVSENIAYGLKLRRWHSSARSRRVEELLELVHLPGLGRRLPRELSGGQQQRVALARALAFGPSLLLMDEPLGALDRRLRLDLEEELRRIHRELGTTILYVTHDQEEALALSNRIAIMHWGQLLAYDTPQRLYDRPTSAFVATFFASANLVPVEVIERQGDNRALVRCLGQQIAVPVGGPWAEGPPVLAVGQHRLQRAASEGQHGLRLAVAVREVLFLGDLTQFVATLPDGTDLTARLRPAEVADLQPGSEAEFFLPAEYAVLVRREVTAP
jgi:putative spermidine/putrescine transport system ATP-binding protein